MTLSTHLLASMNSNANPYLPPVQTPFGPGPSRHSPMPQKTPHVMSAPDGSQWGAHHGMPPWMMSGAGGGRFTPWSEEKVATLQSRLQRKLGPEYITQRPGPGGGPKLSYIEGWKVVNLANEVFGFNGWSSSITSLKIDYLDVKEGDRVNCGITAIVRVTLQDGCYHEDVGFGICENLKGKGAALEKAQKEAVTDGIKRALKYFGNVLGNCLYDRNYTKEVAKVKVGPAKFNVDDLERRPEFTPQGAPMPVSNRTTSIPPPPKFNDAANQRQPPLQQNEAPLSPPLRSIDDLEVSTAEDSYDMGSDSFFDHFDESVLGARVEGDVAMLAPEPVIAPRTTAHAPEAPTYNHRQRPDAPMPPSPPRTVSNPSTNPALQDEQRTFQRVHSGSETTPIANGMRSKLKASDAPKVAITGSGRNARAAAISSAISATSATTPVRSESPRIPTGGVTSAAAVAASRIRAEHQIDIDRSEENGGFGGFASAKGLKRGSGDERSASASPTKPGLARAQAIRSALTEITPDDGGPDTKRGRF